MSGLTDDDPRRAMLMQDLGKMNMENGEMRDKLRRTEEANLALRGELENVKRMWKETIDRNSAALDEIERLRAELQAAREDAELLYAAIVAIREWLWSGRLDQQQKRGHPITAPHDVAETVNAAIDAHEEMGD